MAKSTFIKDALNFIDRAKQFTTKLDPYSTNEFWLKWLKFENEANDIDKYAQIGIQLIELQLKNRRSIRHSYQQLNKFILENLKYFDLTSYNKYLQLAASTYFNDQATLTQIYDAIIVDSRADLDMLIACADLQCHDLELVSKLIDQIHPQPDIDVNKYLYCLLTLFPPEQSTLLINIIKNKKIDSLSFQNDLLLKELYNYKNIPYPTYNILPILQNTRKVGQSKFQQEVQILLNMVQLKYEQEYDVKQLYQVDFYFPELNRILEVNGPQHYIYNMENPDNSLILNGKNYYKQMVLTCLGYDVKNLSFIDFYKTRGVSQRLKLLQDVIDPF